MFSPHDFFSLSDQVTGDNSTAGSEEKKRGRREEEERGRREEKKRGRREEEERGGGASNEVGEQRRGGA